MNHAAYYNRPEQLAQFFRAWRTSYAVLIDSNVFIGGLISYPYLKESDGMGYYLKKCKDTKSAERMAKLVRFRDACSNTLLDKIVQEAMPRQFTFITPDFIEKETRHTVRTRKRLRIFYSAVDGFFRFANDSEANYYTLVTPFSKQLDSARFGDLLPLLTQTQRRIAGDLAPLAGQQFDRALALTAVHIADRTNTDVIILTANMEDFKNVASPLLRYRVEIKSPERFIQLINKPLSI